MNQVQCCFGSSCILTLTNNFRSGMVIHKRSSIQFQSMISPRPCKTMTTWMPPLHVILITVFEQIWSLSSIPTMFYKWAWKQIWSDVSSSDWCTICIKLWVIVMTIWNLEPFPNSLFGMFKISSCSVVICFSGFMQKVQSPKQKVKFRVSSAEWTSQASFSTWIKAHIIGIFKPDFGIGFDSPPDITQILPHFCHNCRAVHQIIV